MGGRSIPVDCPHGVTVDWGDFGPCQNCDDHDGEECPNFVECPQCEVEAEAASRRVSERYRHDQEILARIHACHESGFQIDTGARTLDRAHDLYVWLLHGTHPVQASPPPPGPRGPQPGTDGELAAERRAS